MSETATLKVGDAAPDFELPASPTGDPGPFKLSDHRGSTVVINFVPAAFSPVCSNQLPIIEEQLGSLEGAVTVAIATDNTWTLAAWAQQTGVSYPVLSDFNPIGATAEAYGVLLPGMNMANRVVVVVDADGNVAHIETAPAVVELPDYGPVLACVAG
ncbi:MAG: redoxin domain-containing protein [Chloroflexi bacterium]|nr:redoxin domain-containing protein [Chloroflexota bacterium]